MRSGRRLRIFLISGLAMTALAGCNSRESEPAPQPTASSEPRSIFAEGFDTETAIAEPTLAPLELTIGFPEGDELTETARADLATVLASDQVANGGEIVLRGHSDAGGSDEVNLTASRKRAEAVRDFLVDGGLEEERITIIAFGEQNPVAPNALPDGTPNEEGRAQNRRVEVTVTGDDDGDAAEEPTLIETLATEQDTDAKARNEADQAERPISR